MICNKCGEEYKAAYFSACPSCGIVRSPWYVYIICCGGDRLYTGITTDVQRRYKEHASGKGAKFTRSFHPLELMWESKPMSRSDALKLEIKIKKMTAAKEVGVHTEAMAPMTLKLQEALIEKEKAATGGFD